MYLAFRPAQASDLDGAFAIVRGRHGHAEALRKDMLKIWRAFMESGNGPVMVVEDRDQPAGRKLVAFGSAFFAYDWFIQEAKTSLPPFIDLRVLEMWNSGKRPFLQKEEIVEAQLKEGLNVVSFNWGWDTHRYGPEDTVKIGQTQSQSFISAIAQYRLKEFVQEVQGPEERDILVDFGVDVRRDYKELLGSAFLPRETGKHPYLMSADFGELRKNDARVGTMAKRLAHLGPPRFGFRLNEQDVLKKALMGETDDEIAGSLNLALPTIKKRWQSIYARVAEVDPELLGDAGDMEAAESQGQKQRRRFLLQSLMAHPEELWPNQPDGKKEKN